MKGNDVRSNRARPVAYKPPESWYRITNNRADSAEVYLYDEIGLFGVTASDFVTDLHKLSGDLDLHINSPGGEVFDAIAIYNALKSHKGNVTVTVDGIAASSASFIAMAGDTVRMSRNAQMMIHAAHAICVGNAEDMVKCAALLEKCSDNIADIYSQRAGGSVKDWRERMQGETWFSAEEAVSAGLADEVIRGGSAPRNTWDLSMFRYSGRGAAPAPAIGVTEDGPVPVARLEPDPPPDTPADSPPDEAGFFVPDFATIRDAVSVVAPPSYAIDLDTFRAAVQLGIGDVPAPDAPQDPPPPADEPAFVIDVPAVRRALREASL
jgi:ATP-dependent protease ClpP protease subunit